MSIAGYCLMGNHVHGIAAPRDATGLAKAFGRTHCDYARWLDLRRGEAGHVWQNRCYSCLLDERHAWAALRYVELNPVRAGLEERAIDWPLSSAAAHVTGIEPTGILEDAGWESGWKRGEWRDMLEQGVADEPLIERIREAI